MPFIVVTKEINTLQPHFSEDHNRCNILSVCVCVSRRVCDRAAMRERDMQRARGGVLLRR